LLHENGQEWGSKPRPTDRWRHYAGWEIRTRKYRTEIRLLAAAEGQ